jgi:hypothetical protein
MVYLPADHVFILKHYFASNDLLLFMKHSIVCTMTRIEIGWGGMDWIDLVQDRDQWRALVNMVMNLQVP